jgi:hypothetical protein
MKCFSMQSFSYCLSRYCTLHPYCETPFFTSAKQQHTCNIHKDLICLTLTHLSLHDLVHCELCLNYTTCKLSRGKFCCPHQTVLSSESCTSFTFSGPAPNVFVSTLCVHCASPQALVGVCFYHYNNTEYTRGTSSRFRFSGMRCYVDG